MEIPTHIISKRLQDALADGVHDCHVIETGYSAIDRLNTLARQLDGLERKYIAVIDQLSSTHTSLCNVKKSINEPIPCAAIIDRAIEKGKLFNEKISKANHVY